MVSLRWRDCLLILLVRVLFRARLVDVMRHKPRKPAVTIEDKEARQLIKVAAVMLRDNTRLEFEEVVSAFVYCWQQTESAQQHDDRKAARDRGSNAST